MNNFDERLLGELRTAVADRELAAQIPRRAARRRAALAVAACATLAAGASVVIPSLSDETATEAFAVSQGPDGKVTVKIYRADADAEALERRIESYGVQAEAAFLPAGKVCGNWRGDNAPAGGNVRYSSTDYWGDPSVPPGTLGYTFDPNEAEGATFVIEASVRPGESGPPSRTMVLKARFTRDPVPACQQVDSLSGPNLPPTR